MKSKKLIIFEDKRSGALFIRATKVKKVNGKGKFVMKPIKDGKALGKNTSNEELGRRVREVLNNCD